jgi:hypothetical protein
MGERQIGSVWGSPQFFESEQSAQYAERLECESFNGPAQCPHMGVSVDSLFPWMVY